MDAELYRRAYKVLYDAMLVIAVYDNRGHEDYLHDNGVPTHFMKSGSKTHEEYMRRMDLEIAETAITRVNEILASR